MLIGGWVVLNAALETGDDVASIVEHQRTKVWLNVLLYVMPFWGCVLMDIVMQARYDFVVV